jgi:hypothetical protein
MSDYISREAIKDAMLRYGFKAPDMTVTEFVEDELPAADVEPVRHGAWYPRFEAGDSNKRVISALCVALSITERGFAPFITARTAAQKWI